MADAQAPHFGPMPPAPPSDLQVIWLQPLAPAKPALGAACNGCGVCCSWQPCPVGMLLSRRRQGACTALLWQDRPRHYRCALVDGARQRWPALPRWAEAALRRLARRWIAAGAGCDSTLQVQTAEAADSPG